MAKKIKTPPETMDHSQQFILTLKENHALMPFIEDAQNFVAQLPVNLTREVQFLDIKANLAVLKERPLTAVQLNRLIQSAVIYENIQDYFDQFKLILSSNLQVSAQSRYILDPYCKSDLDFSSEIQQYKKGLFTILFLLFGFYREDLNNQDEFIYTYLSFIHHIYSASTISRTKLRSHADIQSTTLAEIPRNTHVNIHGKPVNTHWVRVTVDIANQHFEGYIQQLYLK